MALKTKAQEKEKVSERPVSLPKQEDSKLPIFAKDVPVSSTKSVSKGVTSVKYVWKEQDSPSEIDRLKVKQICFAAPDDLSNLAGITMKDGVDSLSFWHNDTLYFIRKTNEAVARALLAASHKIKGSVERVVGYISTMLGNFYVISAIGKYAWTFDERLGNRSVEVLGLGSLAESQKEKLFSLGKDALLSLHTQRLVIGNLTLKSLLLNAKGLLLTDLRRLRVVRKGTLLVDDFIAAMRSLLAEGVARPCDVSQAAMEYSLEMEEQCRLWYREANNGIEAPDEHVLFQAIEARMLA